MLTLQSSEPHCFPVAPGLNTTQLNPGLLDVRTAVEWMRDDIAKFGGVSIGGPTWVIGVAMLTGPERS